MKSAVMKTNVQSTAILDEIGIPRKQATSKTPGNTARSLPLWLKIGFTAFMAILVPIYWMKYGPTNFLYFCDVALFLTLVSVWTEKRLPASMAAVGILVVQGIWCLDFAGHFCGIKLLGMTDYMFDAHRPIYLRGLSLFHGWLPFMLLFVVYRLGYDRRALPMWTMLAWALMATSYFFLPPAGAALANSNTPVNIDYVLGFSDAAPQTLMPQWAWLTVLFAGLPLIIYMPTHVALKRLSKASDIR
jgi:hypothetical protein